MFSGAPTVKACSKDRIGCAAPARLLRIALAAHVTRARPVAPILAAAEAQTTRLHARVAVVGIATGTAATVDRGVVTFHLVRQVSGKYRWLLLYVCYYLLP